MTKIIHGTRIKDESVQLSLLITSINIFFRIVSLAAFLPLLMNALSLPKLMRIITPKRKSVMVSNEFVDRIIKITDSVLGINLFMFHHSCLKKSLILYYCLNKYGVDVRIHFGVRKKDGKLDGHCWLTNMGKRVYDYLESVDDFSITYTYPADI